MKAGLLVRTRNGGSASVLRMKRSVFLMVSILDMRRKKMAIKDCGKASYVSVKRRCIDKASMVVIDFSPVCKWPEHPDSTVDRLQEILDIDRIALLAVH